MNVYRPSLLVLAFVGVFTLGAQTGSFSRTVYPVFQEAGCSGCHNSDGVASATRLHFPEPSAPADRIEAFGKSLVVLVDTKSPENSLLLRKPTMRIPHTGGQRIQPGSPEEAALRAWIDRLVQLKGDELAAAMRYRSEEASGAGAARETVALRRLTHSQYNNTVRDLLGDRSQPASQFPPEDFVGGFKNQTVAQSVSPLLEDAYSAAAEKLARNAFRNGTLTVSSGPDFIRTFGRRTFRRPLEPAEQRRYEAILQKQPDVRAGAQLVVEVMLQSPSFLFHLDEPTDPKLRPYAAASRLSYALWDSMPDDALLAAAERGELATPEGVEKATRRLLADPKAREALDEFASQWLRFDRVLTTTRERRRYPQFTPVTAMAMAQEAQRFVSDLVWNNRNFTELFTAPYGYVNGDLARIYGVEPPAEDFTRVPFPETSERGGLLGQALFLTLTAKPDDTSPTARGLFVREQFLCQHVADPPPGVNTNLPPVSASRPMTNRDRMSMHATSKTCAGCHTLIDPIGFGFEKFDAIGQRREKLKLTFGESFGENKSRDQKVTTAEVEIDTKGQLAGIPNSSFSSPKELGAVLAATPQCQECIVKQYFRYVAGRAETPADRPMLRKVTDEFRQSGFRFQEMIVSLMRAREIAAEGVKSSVASNR